MPDVSESTDVYRRPVVYAGRFIDQIASAELPDDYVLLGEQKALPHELIEALDRANTLVLLDLLSFPLEAMTGEHWDVPIVVVLPSDFDAESLTATFGTVLFERLGFFDRVVTPDPALWKELRRKYCWAESQHVAVVSNDPSESTTAIRTLLEAESMSLATPDRDRHGAIQCRRDEPCLNKKALHRVQAAALEPRFAVAREKRGAKVSLDVLEVGTGTGRWVSSFDPTKTSLVGIDICGDLIRTAQDNFPEGRFDHLGSDLLFPYEDESFDLVFSVTTMHHNPAPDKRTLLSEMWRVARPGGRLLFLEDFVFTRRSESPAVYPMSVTEFEDLVLDATAGQVVLEHVESLRYPGEDLRRGELVSLSRLGAPKA